MNREQKHQQIADLKKKYGKFFSPGIETLFAMGSEHLGLPMGHICEKYIEVKDKGKFLEDLRCLVEGVLGGTVELEETVKEAFGVK